jgi:tetratricopeptide (TPR) repeat protein
VGSSMHGNQEECDVDVLSSQVDNVVLGLAEPAEVRKTVAWCLGVAEENGDDALATTLRLLMGRIMLTAGETQEAEHVFRRVVEDDGLSVGGWIGLAETHASQGHLAEADRCLREARGVAESEHDPRGLLLSLDAFVVHSDQPRHRHLQTEALDAMATVLDSDPELDQPPLGNAHILLEEGRGELALRYLASVVRYSLRRSKPGCLYSALRLFAQGCRQARMSDAQIAEALSAFRVFAPSAEADQMFMAMVNRVTRIAS